ncbi:unnamed protein product [Phaedon cochleariae]|uniref:Nuclear RNA export factor 2 n=1 Tax=Phaedon cochleariae TaxID=80249 RepID=A0A9P0DT57_PHACE|nr:unnamed protein product [Phaedon cochleariae]
MMNVNIANMKPISSSIHITETTLPTGIIFKNKHLLTNINCWHKFIVISNVENQSRDTVLGAILDHVHPLDLIPVAYFTDKKGCHFVARNCGPAIQKLCNDNLVVPNGQRPLRLEIILKFATTNEFKIDVQKNIMSVLSRRYDTATKTLNLIRFYEDAELTEFCPLSQPKIMFFVLHLSKNLVPIPEKFLMQDNRIKILNPLEAIGGHTMSVKMLDLRNNWLTTTKALQTLKTFKLSELYLDGNPLCENLSNEEYVDQVKTYCKHLEKLDGLPLNCGPFPRHKKNFLCNEEGVNLVNKFLEHYFSIYDSHNRKMIKDLYHKDALFSLNTLYINGQLSSATTRLFKYNSISRNLHKLADFSRQSKFLVRGNVDIANVLGNLPAVEHDPFSFYVDLMYYTCRCAVIGVSGTFRELPDSLLDSEKLYGFRRTFAVEIADGDGRCYIVNDEMHVHNALSWQVVDSFKVAKTILPDLLRPPQSEKEHQQMVETLRIVTNMNTDWSRKCLEECHYDLKSALGLFVDLYKGDKIPPEGFVGYKRK